jgi:hypothetical protein
MRLLSILLATLITLTTTEQVHATEVERVTIYYYDWDVLTRVAMTAKDVRDRFYVRVDIVNSGEAVKFRDRLLAVKMTDSKEAVGVDVRLVIDLHLPNGKVSSFYASQFRLYSSDGTRSAPIDEEFKRKFRFFEW